MNAHLNIEAQVELKDIFLSCCHWIVIVDYNLRKADGQNVCSVNNKAKNVSCVTLNKYPKGLQIPYNTNQSSAKLITVAKHSLNTPKPSQPKYSAIILQIAQHVSLPKHPHLLQCLVYADWFKTPCDSLAFSSIICSWSYFTAAPPWASLTAGISCGLFKDACYCWLQIHSITHTHHAVISALFSCLKRLLCSICWLFLYQSDY